MLRQPGPSAIGGAVRAGLLLCALCLAACTPRATREAPTQPAEIGAEWSVPSARAAWTLDESASELRVLVYRSGALARLGHNHVLRARHLEARAWEGPGGTLAGAGVDLRIPVAQFLVDDPVDRAAAGLEFAAPVSDEARSGTLANLLRAEVLDAAAFPDLRVRATVMSVLGTTALASARVTIRGVSRAIELPLELHEQDGGLVASGRVALRQSNFGLVPFSIGGGAIAVADELEVDFNLRFASN
jgi:hypothetical protein